MGTARTLPLLLSLLQVHKGTEGLGATVPTGHAAKCIDSGLTINVLSVELFEALGHGVIFISSLFGILQGWLCVSDSSSVYSYTA